MSSVHLNMFFVICTVPTNNRAAKLPTKKQRKARRRHHAKKSTSSLANPTPSQPSRPAKTSGTANGAERLDKEWKKGSGPGSHHFKSPEGNGRRVGQYGGKSREGQ